MYQYDKANRLVDHRQFESRRLTRRELLYGQNGRLEAIRAHRNGRLVETAQYRYNELEQVIWIESLLSDGTVSRKAESE